MASGNLAADDVKKIRELLTHADPAFQRQGVELARAAGDWTPVLEGCAMGDRFTSVQCDWGDVNAAVLELMLTAPTLDAATVTVLNVCQSESLTALPALDGLVALEELDLSECGNLTDLGPVAPLGWLKVLNLDDCISIESLQPLAGLTSLTSLSLDFCDALPDPSPIAALTSLEGLSLEFCQIGDDTLKLLSGLTSLTYLKLADNDISDLSPLRGLGALRELDLSHCQSLTGLSTLAGLESLTELTLDSG